MYQRRSVPLCTPSSSQATLADAGNTLHIPIVTSRHPTAISAGGRAVERGCSATRSRRSPLATLTRSSGGPPQEAKGGKARAKVLTPKSGVELASARWNGRAPHGRPSSPPSTESTAGVDKSDVAPKPPDPDRQSGFSHRIKTKSLVVCGEVSDARSSRPSLAGIFQNACLMRMTGVSSTLQLTMEAQHLRSRRPSRGDATGRRFSRLKREGTNARGAFVCFGRRPHNQNCVPTIS